MQKRTIVAVALVSVLAMGVVVLALQHQRSKEWVKHTSSEPRISPGVEQSTAHPLIRTPTDQVATPSTNMPPENEDEDLSDLVPPPQNLDQSDNSLRQAAEDLNASFTKWLLPNEQVRKWVAFVNMLADGKIPAKNRPFEYPLRPFSVVQKDESIWPDPANGDRLNGLINSVEQISPQQFARYFRAWEPLLQNAQDELGMGGKFRDRLLLAIDRVLAVKPVQGELQLKSKKGSQSYVYIDPEIENASGVEKFMWRLGNINMLRVQAYLQKLKMLIMN